MTIGTVKWFNTRKGYGFIQPSAGGKDVFVHVTKLEKSMMIEGGQPQVILLFFNYFTTQ